MIHFDPDALLAALPRRPIRRFGPEIVVRSNGQRLAPADSALFDKGAYNGFSDRERYRLADLSSCLLKIGCTERPGICDICGASAVDEHAEDYYDLTSWIGLCRRCHRTALHNRYTRPERSAALLDQCEVPDRHWARLVPSEPFDMAALFRSRGRREPMKADYAASDRSAWISPRAP